MTANNAAIIFLGRKTSIDERNASVIKDRSAAVSALAKPSKATISRARRSLCMRTDEKTPRKTKPKTAPAQKPVNTFDGWPADIAEHIDRRYLHNSRRHKPMRNKLPHLTAELPALPVCIDMDAIHPYGPHDEIRDAVLAWWEAEEELALIDAQLDHMRDQARKLHARRIKLKSKQNEVAAVSPQARELLDTCRCVNVGDLHGAFAFFEGYARLHVHKCWRLDPE